MERKEEERVKREQAEIKLQYQMEHRAQMKKEGKANEIKIIFSVIKCCVFSFFVSAHTNPKNKQPDQRLTLFCFYFSYSIFSSLKLNHHNYIHSLLFFNNS